MGRGQGKRVRDEPEMDLGPIWGKIPGKLNRQRELLKF